MARTYLKICFDFEERTSELTPEEQGRLLLALLHYAASGEKERLPGNERFCYPAFCKDIDHDMEIYEGKVANGKQGGRPKKTEQNQQEPKETEQNQRKGEETSIKNKNKSKKKEQEQEQDHEHEQEQEQGQISILTYPPKSPQGGQCH